MILSITDSKNCTNNNASQVNDATRLSSSLTSSSSSSEKSFTANLSMSSDSGLVSTSLATIQIKTKTASTSHSSPIKNIKSSDAKDKTMSSPSSSSSSSSSSGASCASDSSAGADLSILSFSSTSSLTSSMSLDNEFRLYPQKSTPKSTSSSSSEKLLPLSSFLLAPYFMKPFYGKEWFYDKLVDYINTNTSGVCSSRCLILLGDIGTGKSHLSCELKWPTFNAHLASLKYLSKQIVNVYFLNRQLNRGRYCHKENLEQFYLHLSRSLIQDSSLDSASSLSYRPINKDSESDEEFLNRMCLQFVHKVLVPLKQRKGLKLSEVKDEEDDDDEEDAEKNYFILIDGVEDDSEKEDECIQRVFSSSQMILMFLNRIFSHFPYWLHLIFTSKRCVEKK